MESFEVKKCYRWNVGPETGVFEAYLAEDEERIWFESGNSVLKSEIDQKLSSVDEQEYTRYINDQTAKVDQFSQWEKMLGNPTPNSIEPPNPVYGSPPPNQHNNFIAVEEKSPIRIILEKQKKKSIKDISIPFEFNFPSEKAIEFMMMMFDEDEVIEEIVEFALSQMSPEEIKEIIKENITESIKKLLPDVESE